MSDYADDPRKYLDKAIVEQLKAQIDGALALLRGNREMFEKIADTSKLESVLVEAQAELASWVKDE